MMTQFVVASVMALIWLIFTWLQFRDYPKPRQFVACLALTVMIAMLWLSMALVIDPQWLKQELFGHRLTLVRSVTVFGGAMVVYLVANEGKRRRG